MPAENRPERRPRGRPREDKTEIKASQSLERAVAMLKSLSEHDGMTLTQLSERTGLAPSTTHRLLSTLAGHDLVTCDEANQTWAIGLEALRIGMAFQRRNKLLLAGRPAMIDLMEAAGETVNMAMLDKDHVVFVSQIECEAPIRAFFRIGERRAIHASGIGKALLAHMPEARLEAFLKTATLTRFTDKTLTDPVALRAELETIRNRGWSVDDEEANAGMRCVAAVIRNEFGEARAGISLSGPSTRITPDRLNDLGLKVQATALAISRLIGG